MRRWFIAGLLALLVALVPLVASAAEYIVQRGDTLWAISQRYNTTVSAIVAANPSITNPNLIYPGQRLQIPGTSTTPPTGGWTELNVKGIPSTYYNAVHRWDSVTNYYASYYHVDPDLIRRIIYIESKGYQYATGASGEKGLMQIMPFWFKSGENPYNVYTNIGRGTYILHYLRDRWGSWTKAVASYNGGVTSGGYITSRGWYYISLILN